MKRSLPSLACVIALAATASCAGSSSLPPPPPPPTAASPSALPPSSAAAQPVAQPGPSGLPDGNAVRSSIPDEFKWKLDALFADDAAFEQGLKDAGQLRSGLAAFEGKLGQPKRLRECLEPYFRARLATNKVTLYANQRLDSDVRNAKLLDMNDRALAAMNDLMASAAFVRREVLAMKDGAYANAMKAEAGLAQYRPYLDELRRRRTRVLGQQAERVLSLAGDNLWAEIDLNELPSDFEKSFDASLADLALPKVHDEQGQEVQLTLSNYGKLRGSADRAVRKEAVDAFFAALASQRHVFASQLAGQVRFNLFLARSRGYTTARQAYLDKDGIDPAVYDNLLRAVGDNVAPLHRYVRLRKKLMGLPELRSFDLYTPMVRSVPMRFTYDDARRLLPVALAPLGEDYLGVLRTGLDPRNGWVDLLPHKDKRSGAFSASVFGVHPFVKMNYFEGLDDLSTLAHEFGHALHSHLSMTSQPYVTANYVPFIAEIASTFNEKMLSDYLVDHARSDEERLYLLNQMVDRIRTTIYRQALFAEFEHDLHGMAEAGKALTADSMSARYLELVRKYYGPELAIGPDDGFEWAYVPHFYYKFYVYSYATGLSSGIALAQKVKEGGAPARDAYLGMLKGGSSKPPLDLLRGAGVDLTRPDAIVSALGLMGSMLDEMEKTIARMGS